MPPHMWPKVHSKWPHAIFVMHFLLTSWPSFWAAAPFCMPTGGKQRVGPRRCLLSFLWLSLHHCHSSILALTNVDKSPQNCLISIFAPKLIFFIFEVHTFFAPKLENCLFFVRVCLFEFSRQNLKTVSTLIWIFAPFFVFVLIDSIRQLTFTKTRPVLQCYLMRLF